MRTTVSRFRKNGPEISSGLRSGLGLPANCLRVLEKSLKKQWRRYRKDLKRCQNRLSEGTIHDCRVGSRRLLATVELLGGFLSAARVHKVERPQAAPEHL